MSKEKTLVMVRKVKLHPVGDKEEVSRVYKYIRDCSYVTKIVKNKSMSFLYSAFVTGMDNEKKKEEYHKYTRKPNPDKEGYSAYEGIELPDIKGLPVFGDASHAAQDEFKNDIKKGLASGKISLRNTKQGVPVNINKCYLQKRDDPDYPGKKHGGFYHEYPDDREFVEHLDKDKVELYYQFPNNIYFRVDLGNPYNGKEIRSCFAKFWSGEYKTVGSKIMVSKRNEIILSLTFEIPVENNDLNSDIILGVDVGMVYPAYAALNNDNYARRSFGSFDELAKRKESFNAQRKRMQRGLSFAKGGHGRKRKLVKLNDLKTKEKNYTNTYIQQISSEIIRYALSKRAGVIQMEDLSFVREKSDDSVFVMRNWCYADLQSKIEYKAAKPGIEVRYINPAYTSKTCSVCGKAGQRLSQKEFICSDPDCKSHKMYRDNGKYFGADFNAARNIALSTDFFDKKKCRV